jgi:hypothetical protein
VHTPNVEESKSWKDALQPVYDKYVKKIDPAVLQWVTGGAAAAKN